MPGYTAQEVQLLSGIEAAMSNPGQSPGPGFSVDLMLAIFARIVNLRDFASSQATTNASILTRLTNAEVCIALLQAAVSLLQADDSTNTETLQELQSQIEAIQTQAATDEASVSDLRISLDDLTNRVAALENPSGAGGGV